MARSGEELSSTGREAVARAIHDGYRRNQVERKPADDPAMAEWDELPEHLRESNRDQADHIFEKLTAIGCTVVEADGDADLISFTNDEIERMSEMEHERWIAERLAGGWKRGEERDTANKVHPDLVSWAELSEEVREYDREAVRLIPELLAGVGLEIRRR